MRPDPVLLQVLKHDHGAGGGGGDRARLIDGCKVVSNDCGIVITGKKGTGMQGFHSLKRGVSLEAREEARKHGQVQQVQWMKAH